MKTIVMIYLVMIVKKSPNSKPNNKKINNQHFNSILIKFKINETKHERKNIFVKIIKTHFLYNIILNTN